jgi:uncharacterized alpha-E superfamily protein
MLGRTANDLFWMARYMERAENIARLLEVGYRLVLLPHDNGEDEWRSTLRGAACEDAYFEKYKDYTTENVVNFMLLDPDNPSSVYTCLKMARQNARAQRTALTRMTWQSLNAAWLEFSQTAPERTSSNQLPALFEWIKERSALFRGVILNTQLRNDAFYFTQLGTFVERVDNTARIIDVKYYVLLPENQMVGGDVDSAQWRTILRSVSAHRSFQWVYKGGLNPWNIADFLILNRQMPRSLRSCYDELVKSLDELGTYYDEHSPCRGLAENIRASLEQADINQIFQSGLHEFLQDFIGRNNALGLQISKAYYFGDKN